MPGTLPNNLLCLYEERSNHLQMHFKTLLLLHVIEKDNLSVMNLREKKVDVFLFFLHVLEQHNLQQEVHATGTGKSESDLHYQSWWFAEWTKDVHPGGSCDYKLVLFAMQGGSSGMSLIPQISCCWSRMGSRAEKQNAAESRWVVEFPSKVVTTFLWPSYCQDGVKQRWHMEVDALGWKCLLLE